MTIHIGARRGEIAETVLLPGDPMRAKFIAETYLEDVYCYNKVRAMYGFTGKYKGKRVSVQGSGMGLPSISIYANELIREYEVRNLIRVGSCGSLNKQARVRDVILGIGACCESNMNRIRFNDQNYAPVADFELLYKAYNVAKEKGIEVKVGNVLSKDAFYSDNPDWWKVWSEYGVLAIDMEAAELYTLAAKYNVKALTILTVSDSLITGEVTTPEEREKTFTDMMEIALEIAE